jgi:hypothetical protein
MIYQLIQQIQVAVLTLSLAMNMVPISAQEEAGYAYFFDFAGKFIKVELATNRVVAHGALMEVEGLKGVLPTWRGECNTCRVRYDPNLNRLYILASVDGQHSYETMTLRVLAVELPRFKLVGKVDISKAKPGEVGMLVTPDGNRLLVGYEAPSQGENWVFVRETYDTRSFKRMDSKRQAVPRDPYDPIAVAKARFSDKAYFAPDGETIYDEEYAIKGELVAPRPKRSLPAEVERFVKENPNFSRYSPIWLDESGRRILVWEMEYRERIRKHFDGSTGKTTEEKYSTEYATGRFAIYDALAGKKLRELRIKELEGDTPKLISITPDGRLMYFSKWVDEQYGELYAVDLMKEVPPVQLQLFGLDSYHAQCFFADR